MQSGYFIVLEGIDGAGSSTQAKLLVDWFSKNGFVSYLTAEPSKGPIGQMIRQRLQHLDESDAMKAHELALLFAADRLYHVEHEVLPELRKGHMVVSDRYVMSSLAYQGLTLPLEWVKELNRHARVPDCTVLIDTSSEVAAQRRAMRGGQKEIFDEDATQAKLRQRYLDLVSEHSAVVVDGAREIDVIFKDVLSVVEQACDL